MTIPMLEQQEISTLIEALYLAHESCAELRTLYPRDKEERLHDLYTKKAEGFHALAKKLEKLE